MKRWLFDQIHKRNLVYNQCWEDPTIDKQALHIEPADRIVMITSAGCNALDYLLSGPTRIDCVDLNPHQTALLELKVAGLRSLPYSDFFEMFGRGRITGHQKIYVRNLRAQLSPSSQRIWDKHLHYFDPAGPGLYFHGTSGLFARALNWHIDRRRELRAKLEFLQGIPDIARQAAFYNEEIAPRLWSPALRWLLRRQVTMSMLGVPAEQVQQIRNTASADLGKFIRTRVDHVFTSVPLVDNYFWRVYINGEYTRDCCPNYLREEHFDFLRLHCGRIYSHTMALSDFLKYGSGSFSVYILLDHMDWLTNSRELLMEEWTAILQTAQPGARIIYRSGGTSFDHIPDFAKSRIEFRDDIAAVLHQRDRVGTYGSFYVASVRA